MDKSIIKSINLNEEGSLKITELEGRIEYSFVAYPVCERFICDKVCDCVSRVCDILCDKLCTQACEKIW